MTKMAYCAGMLSCVGCLALLEQHGAGYGAVLKRVNETTPLSVAETAVLGASHGHVGAYLLSLWGFESHLVEAVAYACTPSHSPSRAFAPLTAVHIARAMGPRFPLLPPQCHPPDLMDDNYLRECGIAHKVDEWRALAENDGKTACR
ncbi:MAG: Response regulator containing a CheY-like receiver domain and an HTH DNA-binding domain [Rhodospirillaceae bacterium]|nr:MAG: Response regulator containing a CheY-like receiver domain and an HTH DNA-binding domain [Rhodospirillaceae bacterium]